MKKYDFLIVGSGLFGAVFAPFNMNTFFIKGIPNTHQTDKKRQSS